MKSIFHYGRNDCITYNINWYSSKPGHTNTQIQKIEQNFTGGRILPEEGSFLKSIVVISNRSIPTIRAQWIQSRIEAQNNAYTPAPCSFSSSLPSSLLVFRAASDAFPVESLRAREPVAALKYLRIYDECLFTRLLPPVALARGNAT